MKFLSGVWNAENLGGGTFERQGEGKSESLGGEGERGENDSRAWYVIYCHQQQMKAITDLIYFTLAAKRESY